MTAKRKGPKAKASSATCTRAYDAWHAGWNAADDYLKQHYLVICGPCGQPIASACKGVIS